MALQWFAQRVHGNDLLGSVRGQHSDERVSGRPDDRGERSAVIAAQHRRGLRLGTPRGRWRQVTGGIRASFAEANDIPWVRFKKEDRKAQVMAPYLRRR